MRVMLDTNIFISMIFFPSAQTRKFARRLTDSHQIVVCDYVVEELRLVTERKFPAKRKFLDYEMAECAEIKERTTAIVNRLIEKIEVSEPQTIDGEKVQNIRIFYKFVGEIN